MMMLDYDDGMDVKVIGQQSVPSMTMTVNNNNGRSIISAAPATATTASMGKGMSSSDNDNNDTKAINIGDIIEVAGEYHL